MQHIDNIADIPKNPNSKISDDQSYVSNTLAGDITEKDDNIENSEE